MSEGSIDDIVRSSIDSLQNLGGIDEVIGKPINTPSGVTVIPLSSITYGVLNGGFDSGKRLGNKGYGAGGGSGAIIKPVAFLAVSPSGNIELVKVDSDATPLERTLDIIERSPELIQRIKDVLS